MIDIERKLDNALTLEIKSGSVDSLVLVLYSDDANEIIKVIRHKFGDVQAENMVTLIDLQHLSEFHQYKLDLSMLVEGLKNLSLHAVGVVGASAIIKHRLKTLGLSEELGYSKASSRQGAEPASQYNQTLLEFASILDKNRLEIRKELESHYQSQLEIAVSRAVDEIKLTMATPTLVIDRPLRSGQKVYAKGGDLLVLGLVSHGAEVIADGNIYIYAPLRGRALAGASGNKKARIFSECMDPELYSIAGIFQTSENPLPESVQYKSACVRLDGDQLVIEPIKK